MRTSEIAPGLGHIGILNTLPRNFDPSRQNRNYNRGVE